MAVKIVTLSDGTDDLYPVTSAELVAGLPQISNDISTDAASTTKVASPKAVKDYVDAQGGSSATTYQISGEGYLRIALPTNTSDKCVLQIITHKADSFNSDAYGGAVVHIIEAKYDAIEGWYYYCYMLGNPQDSAFADYDGDMNSIYISYDSNYYYVAYYLYVPGGTNSAEVTVLSGTAPSISVVNAAMSGETIDYEHPSTWKRIATTNQIPIISANIINDKTSTSKAIAPKPVYDAVYPATVSTGTSFSANIPYNLGSISGSKTFTLSSPSDSNVINWYYITFSTSSTAPSITWPSGVTWYGGSAPVVSASKTYEIIITKTASTLLGVCLEY